MQVRSVRRIQFVPEVVTDIRTLRRTLATSRFLIQHSPKLENSDQPPHSIEADSPTLCAHYFLDPLSWMRRELEQGKLDGRLECPKCQTNVGKYAWQGMQCSCGSWVVPAVSLLRSKIDKAKNLSTVSG